MDISKFHRTQTHVQMHAQKYALLHVLPCLSMTGVHVPQTALVHPLHSRDRELDEIGVSSASPPGEGTGCLGQTRCRSSCPQQLGRRVTGSREYTWVRKPRLSGAICGFVSEPPFKSPIRACRQTICRVR